MKGTGRASHLLATLKKTWRTPSGITGVSAEIRTLRLPNKCRRRY